MQIDVIIPAHNEEKAIAHVLNEIPDALVSRVIVVDNASSDQTADEALRGGATVVREEIPGYGRACLKGLEWIETSGQRPDIIVFLDGDHSDYPEYMYAVVQPIVEDRADLVIGSRALGELQKGAMTIPQLFGNWLATQLIHLFFGYRFTDLGPFRAIRYSALQKLQMTDKDYGWTVEMQVKAARHGMRCLEVPVPYRKRIGTSKISGTIKGTLLAGNKILWTIFKSI
jgi:glycosyltransferase involved in cell wall biosynthesis